MISFHRSTAKNSDDILKQVKGFTASGLKVPLLWTFRPGRGLAWKEVIRAGSKAAQALSAFGSLVSLGTGIWSVLSGVANIKGSGILSDRIRRTVYDLDVYSSSTFRLYDLLLMREDDGGLEAAASSGWTVPSRRPRILTGLEVHTCWASGAT